MGKESENNSLGLDLDMVDIDEGMDLNFSSEDMEESGLEGNQPLKIENEEELGVKAPGKSEKKDEKEEEDFSINEELKKILEKGKGTKNSPSGGSDSKKEDEADEFAEKQKKSDTPEGKEKTGSGSDSFLTVAYAEALAELGEFSDFDSEKYQEAIKEKGEEEAFADLISEQSAKKAEALKGQYDTYANEYAELRKSGFRKEEATSLVSTKEALESLKEEDISNDEALQENLVRQAYQARGFTAEEIKDEIDGLKDLDKLEARAIKARDYLNNFYDKAIADEKQKRENRQKDLEKEQQTYVNSVEEYVDKTNSYLEGKDINAVTKKKIKEAILKPAGETKDGRKVNAIWKKRLEDPISFDAKLAYFIETGLFDGKASDVEKLSKKQVLSKVKEKLGRGNQEFSTGESFSPEGNEGKAQSTLEALSDVMLDDEF